MKEKQIIELEKTVPIGSVVQWFADTPPANWLILDGATISREEYPELFEIYGTKYGIGDGLTTFNLPDLKGKTVIELDNNQPEFNVLGKIGGEKTHTLTVEEMPKHSHDVRTFPDGGGNTNYYRVSTTPGGNVGDRHWRGGFADFTGGDKPHNNLKPYIVANYIVKAKEETTQVEISNPEQFKPASLHLDKIESQTIRDIPQIINWDIVSGDTDKLIHQAGDIVVNCDATKLIINQWTDVLSTAPVRQTTKVSIERNGILAPVKQISTAANTAPMSFIIEVQKGDIVSIELSYTSTVEINTEKQTYLDILAI